MRARQRSKAPHHSYNVCCREAIHAVPCSGHRPGGSVWDKILCLRHLIVHLDGKRKWPVIPICIQRWRNICCNRDVSRLSDRVKIIKRVCPGRGRASVPHVIKKYPHIHARSRACRKIGPVLARPRERCDSRQSPTVPWQFHPCDSSNRGITRRVCLKHDHLI